VNKLNKIPQFLSKSPILWGALAAAGFYSLVHADLLAGEFVQRYFASHPVEYAATIMFFIALAALVLKVADMVGQYPRLSESLLGSLPKARQGPVDCDALIRRLDRLPRKQQNDHLVRRLREATEHVRRRGSADTLDDHLKYLADLDAERQHGSFALVRVIIWAIPILGFLGTVIGITLAIANLAPEALETSLPEVTAGLGVAFDTTALALGLSIILMFAQFLTDRAETGMLGQVDRRAADELEGRFEQIPAGPEGQLVAIRRMAETVLQTTEQLVHRQADLWQATMEAAGTRWTQLIETSGEKLQAAMAGALVQGLKAHAKELAAATQSIAAENHRHGDQVRQAQSEQMKSLASLQAALVRQGEVLGRAVQATGEVVRLEDGLNRNLAALSGARNFEQTVMSLAAVIHLLNARLTEVPGDRPRVQLQTGSPDTQAA